MKQEIKDQWVTALESDDYKQGRRVLRNSNDEYCCLGVLCDIAVKSGVAKWVQHRDEWVVIPSEFLDVRSVPSVDIGTALLPNFISEWAGVRKFIRDPRVVNAGEVTTLSMLNDHRGYHFTTIANIIKDQLSDGN